MSDSGSGAREALVKTVLVVDDQVGVPGSLQQRGFLRNYERLPFTFVFESCHGPAGYDPELAVQAVARETDADLVLLDLKFGPDDESLLGLEVLRRLTRRFPSVPVLVMSSVERGIEVLGRCLEDGAVGFVEKHKSPEHLKTAIERAVELMRSHVLLGQSAPLKELRRQAARLSPYDQVPVLIAGERGTGKERVARYIHQNGPRRQGPFVAMNCAGVPGAHFEAELFGSAGEQAGASGRLESARGGTLFLDDVGALPHAAQSRLLRVLKERALERPGSGSAPNFQLISATEADPGILVAEGALTADFFDAVAAVVIRTPPLRDCLEDLPLLANDFLRRLVGEKKRFTAAALEALAARRWPGNARELQHVVQEAAIRSEGKALITPAHLFGPRESNLETSRRPQTGGSGKASIGWDRRRLIAELEIAIEAKSRIQAYKGGQWKAEFMREVYPHCKSMNAKGFSDLVKRLTRGPWGEPGAMDDPFLGPLLRELER